jgi:hypothetical protein
VGFSSQLPAFYFNEVTDIGESKEGYPKRDDYLKERTIRWLSLSKPPENEFGYGIEVLKTCKKQDIYYDSPYQDLFSFSIILAFVDPLCKIIIEQHRKQQYQRIGRNENSIKEEGSQQQEHPPELMG